MMEVHCWTCPECGHEADCAEEVDHEHVNRHGVVFARYFATGKEFQTKEESQ